MLTEFNSSQHVVLQNRSCKDHEEIGTNPSEIHGNLPRMSYLTYSAVYVVLICPLEICTLDLS